MKKQVKDWFNKLMGRPPEPLEIRKICAVVGEKTPGVLTVDIDTFNEAGESIGYPTLRGEVKIKPRLRNTVNRILSYESTEADMDVLEMYVFKHCKL